MTKAQKITYYVLLVLISAGFLFAAYPKLIADPQAVTGFATAGLPVWFMYMIGICEVLGVIGLWVKSTTVYAATGLFIVLAGAIGTTLAFMPPLLAILPLCFAIVLAIILWLHSKMARGI